MIFVKMNGHLEVVGELLLNRFGKTNILGLSTRRDLHVSGIHFVWKNPEILFFLQNVTSIFQFFESRRPDRPINRHPLELVNHIFPGVCMVQATVSFITQLSQ